MTGLDLLAGLLAAAAILLARPPVAWLLRRRLGPPTNAPAAAGAISPGPWHHARRRSLLLVAVALAVLVPLLVDVLATAVVIVVLGAIALFAWTRAVAARQRTTADRRRADVGAVLDLISAELRAGVLPTQALVAVAAEVSLLRPAAAVARHGGDVPGALHAAAQTGGAAALADLAQAWQVADRVGAPLAAVLERVAVGVRGDLAVAREAAAEAAPARATGRLMAGLPLLGLALGSGLGADPVRVLLTTLPGAACLALGGAAACAGVVWIDHIADRLTREDGP